MKNGRYNRISIMGHLSWLSVSFLLALPCNCLAADVPGSKDHPLIKRIAESEINIYSQKDYDEYSLFCDVPPSKEAKPLDIAATKEIKRVEGKITRLRYMMPKGVSTLEAQRQYEAALKGSGFEILKSYGPNDISAEWVVSTINQGGQDWYRYPFGPVTPRWSCSSAKRPEGDIFVQLASYDQGENTLTQVDVFEPMAMINKMVDPDASTMAKQMSVDGRVELYGIYFDTDKADIKPESAQTLDQVAALLKNDPALKVSVVGHTDNSGAPEHNRKLSDARANSVVKTLVSKYGINAARLKAMGKGATSPIATNTTEEGKAKNRRVELVKTN